MTLRVISREDLLEALPERFGEEYGGRMDPQGLNVLDGLVWDMDRDEVVCRVYLKMEGSRRATVEVVRVSTDFYNAAPTMENLLSRERREPQGQAVGAVGAAGV